MSPGPREHDSLSEAEQADLVRLADGTLGRRQPEVEARVAASAELAREVAEQRRARDLVGGTAPLAPERLRARVAAERRRAAPAARRRRVGFAAGLAVAAAAAALAVVFLLPSDVPGGTVIAEAAELQALPPEEPPPAPASLTLLDLQQEGVPFPNYRPKFSWRATGVRHDRVRGRDSRTVFYNRAGHRIGYSILSGPLLEPPKDRRTVVIEGTRLYSFDKGQRTVVTWARQGRTCVMSGVGVPRRELYKLAGWKGKGTVPF
jgi:hypothetical protein